MSLSNDSSERCMRPHPTTGYGNCALRKAHDGPHEWDYSVQGNDKSGADLIVAERERQMAEEGWTQAHDDAHTNGQLRQAAAAYLAPGPWVTFGNGGRPENWPWEPLWWKPDTDPIRTLVKAGALIAAEIDRLTRAAALPGSGHRETP